MDSLIINSKQSDSLFREVKSTEIQGCFEIASHIRGDVRGRFVKTFHAEWFQHQGLRSDFIEQYYSVSHRRVLRGLHFQKPPAQHAKLVYCTDGSVLDAVVDLRPGSETFGKHIIRELSADSANMLYLPEGLAHGFYVLSDRATLVYLVTSVYSPEYDGGIHWNSAGIQWPDVEPIVSDRDQQLPSLEASSEVFLDID